MSAAMTLAGSCPAVQANEPDVSLAPAVAANEPMKCRARRARDREYTIAWAPGADPMRGEDVLVAWLRSLSSGIHVVECADSIDCEVSR